MTTVRWTLTSGNLARISCSITLILRRPIVRSRIFGEQIVLIARAHKLGLLRVSWRGNSIARNLDMNVGIGNGRFNPGAVSPDLVVGGLIKLVEILGCLIELRLLLTRSRINIIRGSQ